MLSPAMTIQDQSGRSGSNTVLPICNQNSNEAGSHSMQCFSGDDHALKVRKPYTITKQRERWTEEEHKKFLEALKLHGRAWRRIEEHVGTKTAVQIRSHAQKFFSKVVRESSGSDTNSVKPIEIPPPRPKRKPMHPYPRKVVIPQKGIVLPEQQIRSTSLNSSVSEQENQSPTSVLSVVGSDTLGSADSGTPNGSLSPVSSAAGVNAGSMIGSDSNPLPEENMSPSDVELNDGSSPEEEQKPTRLELFSANNATSKEEGSAGEAPPRSLKLFGKIVLVTDSHRPSSPATATCKSTPSEVEVKESLPEQPSQWNFLPYRAPTAIYYMPFQNENPNAVEPGSAFYGGISFPFIPFLNPASIIAENPDKEIHKEGSLTGSNTESTTEDRTWDAETQSHMGFQLKLSEKSAFSLEKRTKGFVPYKRCFAERDTHSSTITGEEREEQRMRLCL